MAIAPTGNIFKCLEFDGVSSKEFGVYITGQAVYNAPERAVEMISIPNRNGAFALDKGYFENIEVTYPAGIYADTEINFAEAISDFRNFLCSRKGYCRLVDEYNNDEYRMAIYKSGLEVTPANLKAGQFNITFDCKPQRWLMSGEADFELSDGDILLNPTRFDSSPLLAVEGYGTIGFNGYEIEIENAELGEVRLSGGLGFYGTGTITLDTQFLEAGDPIYIKGTMVDFFYSIVATSGKYRFTNASVSSSSNITNSSATISEHYTKVDMTFTADWSDGFVYGTSSTITATATFSLTYTLIAQGTTTTGSVVRTLTATYDGADTITFQRAYTGSTELRVHILNASVPSFYGDSSQSLLGDPTYIDCDFGEAYRIDGDTITSLNQHIDLGSDLPKLASGANEITYDNTITELKITPRWWRV